VPQPTDTSIVAIDKFIQATRDSGYKATMSAVSELLDNALQAGARRIWIILSATRDESYPIEVGVLDDGCGMDEATLLQALRFGGSSRFNDRSGLGRYGMGLPNASLSQARRVEVYSWQTPDRTIFSYLDVDEVASGRLKEVPRAKLVSPPAWPEIETPSSGTAVIWQKCDRLDHRRISTLTRKLGDSLGRIFRHFLWHGVEIRVNGALVTPVDPLYVRKPSVTEGGRQFGEDLVYEINSPTANGSPPKIGAVTVRFSELPVHEWHNLSNDEKRAKGILNGAGVSIVRAGREIDYGWFFMGQKRRENYDDWWRCEVSFDPVLDEAFGITHTKQQVRPREYVLEILSPDFENMARALNARVRQAHLDIKASEGVEETERVAGERGRLLNPLPAVKPSADQGVLLRQLLKRYPALRVKRPSRDRGNTRYRVVEDRFKDTVFYNFALSDNQLIVALNSEHPFYRKLYRVLAAEALANGDRAKAMKMQLDLLLLAAARAEASLSQSERRALAKFRRLWSDILATFLNA
jgi:hypothetical protein